MVSGTKCMKILPIYLKEFGKNESKTRDVKLSIDDLTFTFGCTTKYTKRNILFYINTAKTTIHTNIKKK